MSESRQGIVLQSVGGFYEVEARPTPVYTCRARGIFRKQGVTPMAGDWVRLTILEGGEEGALEEVLPRKNSLVRPPVANLDLLVVVASVVEPSPSTLILDKMIAIAESKGIEPVVVISKADLEDAEGLAAVYRGAGFDTFVVSSSRGEGIEPLRPLLIRQGERLYRKFRRRQVEPPQCDRSPPGAGHRRNQPEAGSGAAHHPHRYPFPAGGRRLHCGHAGFFFSRFGTGGLGVQGGTARLLPGICPLSGRVPVRLLRPRSGAGLCCGGKRWRRERSQPPAMKVM